MKYWHYAFYIVVITTLLFTSCAKRGYITGGPKDTLAPVILSTLPENFSTHFNANTIKINFDEYVKLDKVNQNLIISPPMNTAPEIIPMGFASKAITIKIYDTLLPNTTYSFNFGQSIKDNNEGNPYTGYKYVFSTGTYIDSLKLSGNIQDAYSKKNDNFVNVMLFNAENFNDSTIYKEKPMYVTNTLDSLTSFSIENIKEGRYYLVALKDKNNNYKFDPKGEKIGFLPQEIHIPTDSLYDLVLFKEEKRVNVTRPFMIATNKWLVPYEGDYKNLKMEVMGNNQPIKTVFSKVENKDSLYVYTPNATYDSLQFHFKKDAYGKSFTVKTRKLKQTDSLNISMNKSGKIHFSDTLMIVTSTPVQKIDASRIMLTAKDSSVVPFKLVVDTVHLKTKLLFDKTENQSYTLQLLPAAVTDFYSKENDTLQYKFTTGAYTDYGNLTLSFSNPQNSYPLRIELLNDKEDIFTSVILMENQPIPFKHLPPDKYFVRVIFDENKNGIWDTGNYLEKRQPEKVYYFPTPIDVRANWELNENLVISD